MADNVTALCTGCGWSGEVRFYDIGDGPEWCCPRCDMCYPQNAVIGDDGLTNAERQMLELAREEFRKRHPAGVQVGEIRFR